MLSTTAYRFTIFLHFAIETTTKKQMYNFLLSSKSRMQGFEEPHVARGAAVWPPLY